MSRGGGRPYYRFNHPGTHYPQQQQQQQQQQHSRSSGGGGGPSINSGKGTVPHRPPPRPKGLQPFDPRPSLDLPLLKATLGDYTVTPGPESFRPQLTLHFLPSTTAPSVPADSLSLILEGGAMCLRVQASDIRRIDLLPDQGALEVLTNGKAQIDVRVDGAWVFVEDPSLQGQFQDIERIHCVLDTQRPHLPLSRIREYVHRWSQPSSALRLALPLPGGGGKGSRGKGGGSDPSGSTGPSSSSTTSSPSMSPSLEDRLNEWAYLSSPANASEERRVWIQSRLREDKWLLRLLVASCQLDKTMEPALRSLSSLVMDLAGESGLGTPLATRLLPVASLIPEHILFRHITFLWEEHRVMSQTGIAGGSHRGGKRRGGEGGEGEGGGKRGKVEKKKKKEEGEGEEGEGEEERKKEEEGEDERKKEREDERVKQGKEEKEEERNEDKDSSSSQRIEDEAVQVQVIEEENTEMSNKSDQEEDNEKEEEKNEREDEKEDKEIIMVSDTEGEKENQGKKDQEKQDMMH
ncbi:MAG: hypothetical protein DHS80DRAFT_25496 [Piptocephalis tieghemiana]|nr:MAG: hypothetical protein DHS80DRAFT_25496 [Piptocephalis tieghemiana]